MVISKIIDTSLVYPTLKIKFINQRHEFAGEFAAAAVQGVEHHEQTDEQGLQKQVLNEFC
jgi:hypothetical protein